MKKDNQSSIPRLTRSASLRLRGERPTALNIGSQKCQNGSKQLCRTTPDTPDADDSLSTKSYGSCASFMSCEIGMGSQERNQLANGLNKRYVLHCQRHVETDTKYLTPTQRKDKEIRHLKAALIRTSRSCEEKGVEIERLKSEVDRLRFSNSQSCASLSQPSESPIADFRESDFVDTGMMGASNEENYVINKQGRKFHSSGKICLEDSGILDDLAETEATKFLPDTNENFNYKPHSLKDSATQESLILSSDKTIVEESEESFNLSISLDNHNSKETQTENDIHMQFGYTNSYEKNKDYLPSKWYDEDLYRKENYLRSRSKLENKHFSYFDEEDVSLDTCNSIKSKSSAVEYQEMKEKYNTKIENLLQKLSDQNLRYLELRNGYDKALERIRHLDNQAAELRREMAAQEEWHSQMYLKMYRKGQEAAKFEHADEVLEFAHKAPKRVSVPELLQQLHQTEHELEETKQLYRCELYRQASYAGGDRQAEYTLKFLKDAVYYFLTERDNKEHLRAIESILGFSDGERLTVAKAQRQRKL